MFLCGGMFFLKVMVNFRFAFIYLCFCVFCKVKLYLCQVEQVVVVFLRKNIRMSAFHRLVL